MRTLRPRINFENLTPRGGLQNDVLCSELTLQNQIIKSNTKNAREVNPCFDGDVKDEFEKWFGLISSKAPR